MHWRSILQTISLLNIALAVSMAAPLAIAVFLEEPDAISFALAMGAALAANLPMWLLLRRHEPRIGHREGFVVVALGWFSACMVAALPFWLYGLGGGAPEFASFTNSFFESASGLTTTGATILKDIPALPHASLWWRSIIQWYGGMGIIVFSLFLLPKLGVGGMQLYKAEVPGPTADKATPRLQDTARLLWRIYVLFSAAEVVALMLTGMNVFESFCHTFTTMATGGFSTRAGGVMEFAGQPAIVWTLTFFMFVAGTNFSLHLAAVLNGQWQVYRKDSEFKVYFGLLGVLTLLLTAGLLLKRLYGDPLEALMHAAFQAVAIVTTTGYNSADFEAWGAAAPFLTYLIFVAMFMGGMSGSTGGAIKTIRLLVLSKAGLREVARLIHPHGVFKVRVGERTVNDSVLDGIAGFFVMYLLLFFVGSAVVSLGDLDFITASTAVATSLGNVGPGLGEIGPTDNFWHLADWVKWLLASLMIVGRLELYTILVLLTPSFWRH